MAHRCSGFVHQQVNMRSAALVAFDCNEVTEFASVFAQSLNVKLDLSYERFAAFLKLLVFWERFVKRSASSEVDTGETDQPELLFRR